MKLPRWFVVCLISSSVLTVLAAAGCWWVTWPERTAREFADFVVEGKFDKAEQMMEPQAGGRLSEQSSFERLQGRFEREFQLESPTVLDLLSGRRRFGTAGGRGEFTAERGKIACKWIVWEMRPFIVEMLANHPLALSADEEEVMTPFVFELDTEDPP